MVEFQTESSEGPSQKDEDSGDYSVNDFLNQAAKNLQGNKDAQMVLASALEDNGIDPRFLSVFSDDLASLMRQAQEQKARKEQENQTDRQENQTQADKEQEIQQMTQESPEMENEVAEAESMTVEDLIGFINDLKAILPNGGETTLNDVEELAEQNPDVVQNQIDARL